MKGKVLVMKENKKICILVKNSIFGDELCYEPKYKYTTILKSNETVLLALNARKYCPDRTKYERFFIGELKSEIWQAPR